MIRFFEILSFLLAWGYTAIFFLILKSFLPLRKNVVLKVIAFLVCGYLADSIIYSNDAGSLFGTMMLLFLYVLCFIVGHSWRNYRSCLFFIQHSLPLTT